MHHDTVCKMSPRSIKCTDQRCQIISHLFLIVVLISHSIILLMFGHSHFQNTLFYRIYSFFEKNSCHEASVCTSTIESNIMCSYERAKFRGQKTGQEQGQGQGQSHTLLFCFVPLLALVLGLYLARHQYILELTFKHSHAANYHPWFASQVPAN